MAISIIIADDHPVVRLGLRSLLDRESGFSVVGEAADGDDTVKQVQDRKPKVLILDLLMPRLSGMQVMDHIKKSTPDTRIIVLSMYRDRSYVSDALQRGANGYVVKDSMAEEIVQAIHAVMKGKQYLPEHLALGNALPGYETASAACNDRANMLTIREAEILGLIASGKANKEMAEHLGISVRTVEAHRARIRRKLNLKTHAALIHYATLHHPQTQA